LLNHWNCGKCNSYNDVLDNHCHYCNSYKPEHITEIYQGIVEIRRDIFLSHGVLGIDKMNEREEKFKTLFQAAYERALDVNILTIQELEAWEVELVDIAFTAKTTLQGVSKAKGERVSKLSKSERDKLITSPELLVSDAVSTVKKRADRMSKIDKLILSMKAMNMSEEDIKSALANVKVDESKQTLESEKSQPTEVRTVFNGTPEPIDTCPLCNADYLAKEGHKCSAKSAETKIETKVDSFNPFESQAEARFDRSNDIVTVVKEIKEEIKQEIKPKKEEDFNPFK
jgi:DNA repair exonuclease SbcCD ATPase subunit